jgi:hypothetical protein
MAPTTQKSTARLTPLSGVYGYSELLTPDGYNPKTRKGRARGYSTAILHFAPANLSGYEVCSDRSAGCTHDCLNLSGHGAIGLDVETAVSLTNTNEVQDARIARTHLLFRQRATFFSEMVLAISTHVRRATAHGLTPTVRLNGTSDLPWERMPFTDVDGVEYASLFERFPDVQFYDYTKHPARAMLSALGALPANYVVTFSRSETNERIALDVLRNGGNVAVVFNARTAHAKRPADPLPATWHGFTVVDGDHDDLRFLDPTNVVVGLRAKGPRAKHDTSGFVVDVASDACSNVIALSTVARAA